jgi:dihydrofolate reductase
MATVLYSASMSLDGFIAGPGGDMSWLADHLGPNPAAEDLVTRIGALLVGRRSWDGDDPHRGDPEKEGAFEGRWQGPQFVLSHRPPAEAEPDATFVEDLSEALKLAGEAAGERYVNIIGADVARQCLAAGALDEVLVFVVPVLLGDGVRLFDHPGGVHVDLERIRSETLPQADLLWFRVVR